MKNIFTQAVTNELIDRINQLTPSTQPKWGKMNVAQMLAHCNVTYELAFENKHPKPNFIARFFLKLFVKPSVVSEKPYPKNSRTAPVFLVANKQDFNKEKKRLIVYLEKTQQLGEAHFEQRAYTSFGTLSSKEWSNLFYKHLDHHLSQFGV